MKVPLLDLKPQLAELRDEILEKITSVIDSTRYIQGPEVAALEEEISHYCGVSEGVGVSSGTDALLVALMALDLDPGDLRRIRLCWLSGLAVVTRLLFLLFPL